MAWVGAFAILFQALLFGWHHHEPIFARHHSVTVVENPAAAAQALDDEDGCEICQVLHHLFAAPVDFIGPPHSCPGGTNGIAADPVFAARPCTYGYYARAPPSPDAAFD